MKNRFLLPLSGEYIIKVSGKNILSFFNYCHKEKIIISELKHIDEKTIKIKVLKSDYQKLKKLKKNYKIKIIGRTGVLKLKKDWKKNKHLIVAIICGYFILLVLNSIIFEVKIIHEKKEIRAIIQSSMEKYNLKPLTFKKSFKEISKIKQKILADNKEKLEWLEISIYGSSYIVKAEERRKSIPKEEYKHQHIIAKKDGLIVNVYAKTGEIIYDKNEYVKKGTIIISGNITKDGNVVKKVKAEGNVLAEVWYRVSVEYPLKQTVIHSTETVKNSYKLKFLNFDFYLWNKNPFKNQIKKEEVILSHSFLPFQLIRVKNRKTIVEKKIYSKDEALLAAKKLAQEKLLGKDNEERKIIEEKILKYYVNSSKIYLDIFYVVLEDIALPSEIKEEAKN